jgi:hypothetical protein
MVENGIGLAEALLGLDGFRVLEVTEGENEVVVRVETTAEMVACPRCGERAESKDRVERHLHLPIPRRACTQREPEGRCE